MQYVDEKKPDSIKVKETKARLQTAFMQLIRQKPIEQITIQNITELADLNRTSFYRYYLDIYDLYDKIADEFIERFQHLMPKILLQMLRTDTFAWKTEILTFWRNNQQLVEIIFGDSKMLNRLKESNIAYIKTNFLLSETDYTIDAMLEWFVSGQIGLLGYWFQHMDKLSDEEVLQLLQTIMLNGPVAVLREKLSLDILQQLSL